MSFAIVNCSSVIPLCALNFSSSSNNSSEVAKNDLMRSDINRLKWYFLTIWNIDNVMHWYVLSYSFLSVKEKPLSTLFSFLNYTPFKNYLANFSSLPSRFGPSSTISRYLIHSFALGFDICSKQQSDVQGFDRRKENVTKEYTICAICGLHTSESKRPSVQHFDENYRGCWLDYFRCSDCWQEEVILITIAH